MHKFTKRAVVVAVAAVLAIGGAGVAFAYWTAGGSGAGEAQTGTTIGLVAVQTTVVEEMKPGDSPQPLSGNFNNPNDGPAYVATVTASIASVDKAVGAPAGTCNATDYTLATPVAVVGAEVAPGDAQGAWAGATIKFNNKAGVNQDGCKGATVNLAYAIA